MFSCSSALQMSTASAVVTVRIFYILVISHYPVSYKKMQILSHSRCIIHHKSSRLDVQRHITPPQYSSHVHTLDGFVCRAVFPATDLRSISTKLIQYRIIKHGDCGFLKLITAPVQQMTRYYSLPLVQMCSTFYRKMCVRAACVYEPKKMILYQAC